MKSKLEDIFNVFGESVNVNKIDNNSELYEVMTNKHGKIVVCAKGITFGGRENLSYEQRIQIKGYSNNYAFDKLSCNEKAILLGVGSTNEGETILCTFKIKYSTAVNTISKQIKNSTIEKALSDGFAQQLKGNEYACAFRKEFLYFYLENLEWIHDTTVDQLNNHFAQETDSTYEIVEENRIKGGTNILLYGVPGSGKSNTIKTEYCNNPLYMERVVFHPDYTYSDFVGQILPRVREGRITYEFTSGPFTSILKKAQNNPEEKFYLIIEEINRGNAPAIFGEVFQLLDRDENGNSEYSISNSDVAKVVYSDEECLVSLPSNLYILATMNTSDQNVFTLDTAFQRRWKMKMIENNVNLAYHADTEILDTRIKWKKFNTIFNNLIVENSIGISSAEDKRLGAYFVRSEDLKLYEDRDNSNFAEKVLKYLWDDAFKFSRSSIFMDNYRTLEEVVKTFNISSGIERFKIFKPEIVNLLLAQID